MANIPKLRLMLARMEKTASARWRTLQGLTALLGKDVVAATPRIGALQLAAKQQGIKLPGEGFAKAMSSLPEGPIGATVNTSKPIEPSQVFRGGKQPADFIRGGYSTEYLHATPFKPIAGAYGEIQQPKLIGPRSKYNELNHNNDSGLIYNPKSLIGVYGTTKNQRYAPDFGFERNSNQQMGMDRLDPNKGLGYAYRAWQDSMRQKDFLRQWGLPKGSGYPADTRGNPLDQHLNALLHTSSNRYETLVKPSQLQSLLLDDRVLPATAKGRELLQTGTMPAGAQLPPEILKSAEELPWRDRVEVYTQNPKGKIYGGIWDSDKSFALPGGGIDEGEDPLVAALRELKEETGITAKNPRLLPIDPVDSPWSDAHRAKIKRNFAGSRTHFVLADAMGRRGNKNLDVWNASNRGYYTPAKAIDIMNSNTNYMAPTAAAARLKALQHIQSLAMAAAKEKSAAPMNLYSYIPNGSIEHVKKHGLLSGNELAKPENRHLLDIARPDGDADRWLKERNARLAKSPWTNSYNGPSAFFGDIDAGKIHDKHPIKKFDTTRAVIKLRELLRDYPTTKMEGSELIPFSDTTYDALDEKGQNEFVNKRHHTLSLNEIKALLTRGQNPKDMWKDFKDTEGKYYASDVPHAQVVTPMGKIPSKYIEFK